MIKSIFLPKLYGPNLNLKAVKVFNDFEKPRELKCFKNINISELGSIVRTAIRQGGVASLWQGLGPSLLRDVPFSGIWRVENFETSRLLVLRH